jgi:hypothetical protein
MADKSKFIDYIDDALEKSKETTLSQLFLTYQGIPYPVTMCTQETFRALDAFEARSDDVLLASYPKCGKADLSLRVHFGRRWERAKVGRRRFVSTWNTLEISREETRTGECMRYKVNN